jgi:methyltransferase (TIGR00027 family)
MRAGQPSLTALGAAGHRAAHQIAESGSIFCDPFARRILSRKECARADERAADPASRPMRLFVSARSRFAEDALARAHRRGLRQAVILGAGLDTFALRNPFADLAVFEADHPATQISKRRRLAEAGLSPPPLLTYVSIDFERQSLGARLSEDGVRFDRPCFYMWLGVTPYLSREAVFAVLRFVADARGNEIAFDYSEPFENYSPQARARAEAFAARVAMLGEPLVGRFEPFELGAALKSMGYCEVEDLDGRSIAARYFPQDAVAALGGGGHFVRARVG